MDRVETAQEALPGHGDWGAGWLWWLRGEVKLALWTRAVYLSVCSPFPRVEKQV